MSVDQNKKQQQQEATDKPVLRTGNISSKAENKDTERKKYKYKVKKSPESVLIIEELDRELDQSVLIIGLVCNVKDLKIQGNNG